LKQGMSVLARASSNFNRPTEASESTVSCRLESAVSSRYLTTTTDERMLNRRLRVRYSNSDLESAYVSETVIVICGYGS
jgi:hypothetical protein